MNIEASKVNLTEKKETNKVNNNKTTEVSVKFTDELSNVAQTEDANIKNIETEDTKDNSSNIDSKKDKEVSSFENINPEIHISTAQTNIAFEINKKVDDTNALNEKPEEKTRILDNIIDNIPTENKITKKNKLAIEDNTSDIKNSSNNIKTELEKISHKKIKTNIFAKENIHINKALDNLNSVVKELNQSDDNIIDPIKKEEISTDNKNMINNDFNIQENKELLPQMSPNMNFSGDGQPFSSFMNNEENAKKETKVALHSSAQELAEEAAILSTMAENIAIANKNQIVPSQEVIKTVNREDGIKKVDTKTNITIETVVKYDTIIMNEADVEVFANLVENKKIDIRNLSTQATEKSVQISKTLADMLAKAMEKNQPVRIDFDNNISVIIKISRDGKITADFLPSSQVAEAYLKENLPLLRQRFNDNNIEYDSLNQRERRDSNKENNRRKGRNNE